VTVVEHTTHNSIKGGLIPATGTKREKKVKRLFIIEIKSKSKEKNFFTLTNKHPLQIKSFFEIVKKKRSCFQKVCFPTKKIF
jgi:hypothetical protein